MDAVKLFVTVKLCVSCVVESLPIVIFSVDPEIEYDIIFFAFVNDLTLSVRRFPSTNKVLIYVDIVVLFISPILIVLSVLLALIICIVLSEDFIKSVFNWVVIVKLLVSCLVDFVESPIVIVLVNGS